MLVIDFLKSMSVVGLFSPSYKYLKHGADQLDNKSFVSGAFFFYVKQSYFFLREREKRERDIKQGSQKCSFAEDTI